MTRHLAISVGLLAGTLASAAHARPTTNASATLAAPAPSAGETPGRAPAATRDKVTQPTDHASKERAEEWTLAVEGAANIPLDVGVEAGLDTPVGLRLSGGYGWIVAPYAAFLRGASISEGSARATIDQAQASGHLLRAKLGIRPFRKLGLYFDVGYARAELDGTLDVTGSISGLGSISGGYSARSSLDMWLVELGYQAKIENRLVLALGLGFTGTFAATTTISPLGVAQQGDATAIRLAESSADQAFEKYGYLPTLNLRLGFNLL